MRHTSIVPSHGLALGKPLLWITLLAVKGMLLSATAAISEGHLVLDLTTKDPPASESLGVPGMAVGVIVEAGVTVPSLYPLPLDVKIQSVRPLSLSVGQKFVVEALLRNQGTTPFYLPASRDYPKAHRTGNKNRRCMEFMLRFLPPDDPHPSPMKFTMGSPTVPESLLRLQPQESVLVRFEGNLSSVAHRVSTGARTLRIQVACSEYTLEDDRYFIKARSKEVQSQNAIEIAVQP